MELTDKVAMITGGGGGIGAALAEALVREGAKVVVVDVNLPAAEAVSEALNRKYPGSALAVAADATDASDVSRTADQAETHFGPVGMYFANAGIAGPPGLDAVESDWKRTFDVNIWAHVIAAQVMVPRWLERGDGGYFVSTASAAGLLTQLGMPAYSVAKHAALGFAEWLSVTYGDRGIRVSALCPMGVETPLLRAGELSGDPRGYVGSRSVTSAGAVLQPPELAEVVIRALEEERFLILPHPEVLDMYRRKAADHDGWIEGMRRFQARLEGSGKEAR